MQKKLTISIDEHVYNNLYSVIGKRKIGKFIEKLVKPYVIIEDLESSYIEMSEDDDRETKALQWIEGVIDGY